MKNKNKGKDGEVIDEIGDLLEALNLDKDMQINKDGKENSNSNDNHTNNLDYDSEDDTTEKKILNTESDSQDEDDQVIESIRLDEEADGEDIQYTSKGPVFRGNNQDARHNPYGRVSKVIVTPSDP